VRQPRNDEPAGAGYSVAYTLKVMLGAGTRVELVTALPAFVSDRCVVFSGMYMLLLFIES
jgi:hypothetical protein